MSSACGVALVVDPRRRRRRRPAPRPRRRPPPARWTARSSRWTPRPAPAARRPDRRPAPAPHLPNVVASTVGPGSAANSSDQLVDPRVRRLQRERPLLVVAPPGPGRGGGRDEPGEHDVAAGTPRPAAGPGPTISANRGVNHGLPGSPNTRCMSMTASAAGPPPAGPTAGWSSLGGGGLQRRAPPGPAPPTGRTPRSRRTRCTSATSTPRLANAQAPVLPPRPNGPSR